jgi:hypothetical protein
MSKEPMTPLGEALERLRGKMSQKRLADLVGTSKQQIGKLVHDVNGMSVDWAKRIGPYVEVPWPKLMGWDQQTLTELALYSTSDLGSESLIVPDQAKVTTGPTQPGRRAEASEAPQIGQFVDDTDELALLGFWRFLKPDERHFMLGLLRNGALSRRTK